MVDYPNSTKKRKMYLCLMVGHQEVPSGLTEGMDVEDASSTKVKNEKRRKARAMASKKMKGKKALGSVDKDWILKKKELYRQRKGVEQVPRDSKASLSASRLESRPPVLIVLVPLRNSLPEERERPVFKFSRACLLFGRFSVDLSQSQLYDLSCNIWIQKRQRRGRVTGRNLRLLQKLPRSTRPPNLL